MHDYLFPSEVVRFAFVFGVVVAMLLYERRHLTVGSIVVPGYIAIFIVAPMVLFITFLNAGITYLLMNKLIRRRFLLYGRSKFTVMALISIAMQSVLLRVTPAGPWLWESDFPLFVGAGYVVPALIAHDMGRQGVQRTIKAVMLAGAIVATPILLAVAFRLDGITDLAPLSGYGEMSISGTWVSIAVLLSAAAAWAVTTNYGFKSGGFVGAAYVGMFMGDPYQVAVMFAIAIVSYVFVRMVLMRWLILFGRRKFSAMLLTSSMISWTLLWTGQWIFDARVTSHLDMASLALTPLFVPGLLANDMDRTSPLRVGMGVTLAAGMVVPVTWWVQATAEGTDLHSAWKVLAVVTVLAVFGPQLRQLTVLAVRALRTIPDRLRDRRSHAGLRPAAAIAAGGPAEDQDHLGGPVDAPWSLDELETWRRTHVEASLDADAWLAEQLAELSIATPSPTDAYLVGLMTLERHHAHLGRLAKLDTVTAAPARVDANLPADLDEVFTHSAADHDLAATLRAAWSQLQTDELAASHEDWPRW